MSERGRSSICNHYSFVSARAAVVAAVVAVTLSAACSGLPQGSKESQVEKLSAQPFVPSVGPALQSSDLYHLKSVSEVRISPDGTRGAYSVQNNDRPGRPYSQVWVLDVTTGTSTRLGSEEETSSNPLWSPDGKRIAYIGRQDEENVWVLVSNADGTEPIFLAPLSGTNHPLPSSGERLAWSPDGKQLAFLSSVRGPETEGASGDPMVITRYLYKPTASEGLTRFNDNRRLHIFITDIATKHVRQLTEGDYYEHSIDWSPHGDEIVFISNHESDPDRVFNYDIFAVNVVDGVIRRLTDTKNAEYRPTWSPDGRTIAYLSTKRPLTSSETTMEDTHVWLIDATGQNRREIGGVIDNRQGLPRWTPDGRAVCFTVQERGSVRLYRLPVDGGPPRLIVPSSTEQGVVGSWSIAQGDAIAYAFTTPSAPAELYVKWITGDARPLTSLNEDLRIPAKVNADSRGS